MELSLVGVSARHPAARADTGAALREATLQLRSGEAVAVIGPSGAGKTTLLHTAALALRPAAGNVRLGGVDPWTLRRAALQDLRGQLFLAPQAPPLPPRQRAITAVLAGRLPQWSLTRSLRSLFYPTDIPAAFDALARFELGDKLFERVDRLSGGERQRVGLARALLAPARLWLIDEPLSALDPARAERAIDTLVDEARTRGVTLLASLHHVEMALTRFPRIVGLRDGRIEFDLPAAEVTPDRLVRLYAQHEDELHGPAPEPAPLSAPQPVVMHCR